jgi:hypothetical protein
MCTDCVIIDQDRHIQTESERIRAQIAQSSIEVTIFKLIMNVLSHNPVTLNKRFNKAISLSMIYEKISDTLDLFFELLSPCSP